MASGAVVILAALLIVKHQDRERPRKAATSDMDLAPAAAYDSATGLASRQRFRTSLPYFRHALRTQSVRDWEPHFAFAAALNNATLQFTTRCGASAPETRSSAERVELMTEALAEYELAARLAPDGVTRAKVLGTWANTLYVNGFPWDAFVLYRQANLADPSDPSYAGKGDALMDALYDPSHGSLAPAPIVDDAPRTDFPRGDR